jgi:DNA-binding Xre family transcriptional regulator
MTDASHDDSILKRIRSRVPGAAGTPRQPAAPAQDEAELRKALRQMARSRVSQMLGQLRAARGLSYEQVRQRTGLTMQLLYDVEYRDRSLTVDELRLLAICYEVSVNDILGIDLEP